MNLVAIQVTLELWGAFFCIMCAGITFYGRETKRARNGILSWGLLINAALLVFDSLAYIFRGNVTHIGYVMVRASNCIVFVCTALLFFIVSVYMGELIKSHGFTRKGRLSEIIYLCTSLDIFVILYAQTTSFIYYFDENNVYHRGEGYLIIVVFSLVIILMTIINLVINRKSLKRSEFVSIMIYLFLPIISAITQFFIYGISLNNVVSTLGIMLIFVLNEMEKSDRIIKLNKEILENELTIAKREKELIVRQNQVAVSQIQPHFILNSLSSISMLCRIDGERAGEAVDHFATYLRNNINALSKISMINFNEELEHIHTYIWLEQMRFGDMLNYTEELEVEMFMVPSLSVQPIVENAVKYALKSREGVVDVSLSTRRAASGIEIVVKDNGMGFDVNASKDDGRVHVGIANVRERLNMTCKGEINIDSVLGEGTTVTIMIPESDEEE